MTKEVGRGLNQARQFRNSARYNFHAEKVKEKAEEVIMLAETLVALLEMDIS